MRDISPAAPCHLSAAVESIARDIQYHAFDHFSSKAAPMFGRPLRIWQCVAIFVVANVASILPAGFNGDEAFYLQLRMPWIAPPDWLFPPMWFFLNVTSLVALYRVSHAEPSRSRILFIGSEMVGWVLFAVFSGLFFGLQSPVLGAINTGLGLVVAIFSVVVGWRSDRISAGLIALRVAWLLLATYVSSYIATHNADAFLGIRPLW